MARGVEIVVSAEPGGHFLEGIVSGTPSPGTLMEIVPGTVADANGRHTWRVFSGSSGAKQPVVVLLDDTDQGHNQTDAYVSGARVRLYVPHQGDELNMLIADIAGTGDVHTVGDFLGAQTNTGLLIANSSFASFPFMAMETIPAPIANTLMWVMYW